MSRISCTLFQCKEGGNLSHLLFSFLYYVGTGSSSTEAVSFLFLPGESGAVSFGRFP